MLVNCEHPKCNTLVSTTDLIGAGRYVYGQESDPNKDKNFCSSKCLCDYAKYYSDTDTEG